MYLLCMYVHLPAIESVHTRLGQLSADYWPTVVHMIVIQPPIGVFRRLLSIAHHRTFGNIIICKLFAENLFCLPSAGQASLALATPMKYDPLPSRAWSRDYYVYAWLCTQHNYATVVNSVCRTCKQQWLNRAGGLGVKGQSAWGQWVEKRLTEAWQQQGSCPQ